jgi:hypothetical protein
MAKVKNVEREAVLRHYRGIFQEMKDLKKSFAVLP